MFRSDDYRREFAKARTGWKQTERVKKQIGETQRNFSPEKKAKKEAGARATRAITKKRKQEARRIEEMANRLKRAKQKIEPKPMTGTQQAAYVVIRANREMTEKEVVFEMKRLFGWKTKKAITPLLRASGINARTYLPHGNKDYERLERVETKLGNGRSIYVYRPLAVFTRWMIPDKQELIQ